jgi:hypothetical protein
VIDWNWYRLPHSADRSADSESKTRVNALVKPEGRSVVCDCGKRRFGIEAGRIMRDKKSN